MSRTFATGGKTVFVFHSNRPGSPVIYLNTYSNEGQKVYEAAQAVGCPPFSLVTISNLDWNHDMAPWDSPPAFKNAEPCTGGADDYLRLLTEEIIPTAEKEIDGAPWLGILWRGCLRCMPSTRRICFLGWAAYPALSGFQE